MKAHLELQSECSKNQLYSQEEKPQVVLHRAAMRVFKDIFP